MPSPVGHSLIGLIFIQRFYSSPVKWKIMFIMAVIIVSNLPDFDFIPGFISGTPNLYHHGISHSLGFVLILSVLLFSLLRIARRQNAANLTLWFFTLTSLHILLDFFALDTTPPFGEPIFWPLTNQYVISPFSLFLDIQRSGVSSQFLSSLFSWHNFKAIGMELLFVCVVWLLLRGMRRSE